MLALAEILGLIILNALFHTAFTRWKLARRTSPAKLPSATQVSTKTSESTVRSPRRRVNSPRR